MEELALAGELNDFNVKEILIFLVNQRRNLSVEQMASTTFSDHMTESGLKHFGIVASGLVAIQSLLTRYGLDKYEVTFHSWKGNDMVLYLPDTLELPTVRTPNKEEVKNAIITDFR